MSASECVCIFFSPFLPQSAQTSLPSSPLSAKMALLLGESEVDMPSFEVDGACDFDIGKEMAYLKGV